jgi:hypothetical protein
VFHGYHIEEVASLEAGVAIASVEGRIRVDWRYTLKFKLDRLAVTTPMISVLKRFGRAE